MTYATLPDDDVSFFAHVTLSWVFFAFGTLFFALIGFFDPVVLTILALVLLFRLWKKCKTLTISPHYRTVAIFFLAVAIVFSLFATPSIFSGRDHGAMAEAAIQLSQNGDLTFANESSLAFFEIYGPGKALNYPGFFYTEAGELITQFPLPYITWLASFHTFFGVHGLQLANALLFFFFLLAFSTLGRIFFCTKHQFFLILLALSAFAFTWVMKFTLSENMALALLWSFITLLVVMVQRHTPLPYWAWLAAGVLLVFARIEGGILFLFGVAVLVSHKEIRAWLANDFPWRVFAPTVSLVVLGGVLLATNTAFYTSVAKALLQNSENTLAAPVGNALADVVYNLSVLTLYGALPFLTIGICVITYLLWRKNTLALVPFFVILPVFYYLLDPNISADHPWMLRRYIFALIPLGLFYTVYVIAQIDVTTKTKRVPLRSLVAEGIFLILLVVNAIPTAVFFLDRENATLNKQIVTFAQHFDSDDLVLVDRDAAGSGWAMITGPMRFIAGKNAVYFFNPEDLTKIDTERFDRVFLVTPRSNESFYLNSMLGDKMFYETKYSFVVQQRAVEETPENLLRYPPLEDRVTHGVVYRVEL